MDIDLLRKHVADGLIYQRAHPSLPLHIYNYSPRVQYERLWDDVTRRARGLVMCGDEIVARPLPKFFNAGEHAEGTIPWHLRSEITEKLDGSLLIVFFFDGKWHFATRGSFTSPQADAGCDIFFGRYSHVRLDRTVTYLFEVIYPENRIVVDYGGKRDTILLAMIETVTGRELSLSEAPSGMNVVRRLPADADASKLRELIRDDEEGYVVRFENGFRVKIKGERYMQLHKLLTGITSRTIWEHLSQRIPLDDMLAITPDEFNGWVKSEVASQGAAFNKAMQRVWESNAACVGLKSRKEQALKIMADYRDVSAAAFAYLDGKAVEPILWKLIYPELRRPEIAERIAA